MILKLISNTETYEETKSLNANDIIQSAYYDGNSNFALNHYNNLFVKTFFQLEEAVPVCTLAESQKINSFKNALKEPKDINFSLTEKGS